MDLACVTPHPSRVAQGISLLNDTCSDLSSQSSKYPTELVAKLQSPLVANSQTRQRYSDIEEVEIARMGGVHAGCRLFPPSPVPGRYDRRTPDTGRDRAVATQLMTQVFPLCLVDCLGASRRLRIASRDPRVEFAMPQFTCAAGSDPEGFLLCRSQFRHGQSTESVSDSKTVRCAANDRAAGNPRLAHHVAR